MKPCNPRSADAYGW